MLQDKTGRLPQSHKHKEVTDTHESMSFSSPTCCTLTLVKHFQVCALYALIKEVFHSPL